MSAAGWLALARDLCAPALPCAFCREPIGHALGCPNDPYTIILDPSTCSRCGADLNRVYRCTSCEVAA